MLQTIKSKLRDRWKEIATVVVVAVVLFVAFQLIQGFKNAVIAAFTWVISWFGYKARERHIKKIEDASKKDLRDLVQHANTVPSQIQKQDQKIDATTHNLAIPKPTPAQDKQDVLSMLGLLEKDKKP